MRLREDIVIVTPGADDIKVKGALDNVGRSEDPAEGDLTTSDWLLFLPKGTAITHKSRVQGRGLEFEVQGPPDELSRVLTTGGAHHIEVALKVVGSEESEGFTDKEDF